MEKCTSVSAVFYRIPPRVAVSFNNFRWVTIWRGRTRYDCIYGLKILHCDYTSEKKHKKWFLRNSITITQ